MDAFIGFWGKSEVIGGIKSMEGYVSIVTSKYKSGRGKI